ncbi:MAG TPA: hypothetical protein VKU00_13270, partial [Chthonomonadaceae bacterium]|nr:hypothetical protein [Chthonomonadaceae bacterium]
MEQVGMPLQQKLDATRRWWRTTRLLGGFAWMLCIIIALGLLCYHLDSRLVLSSTAREAWRWAIALAGFGVLCAAGALALLRRMPNADVAA